MVQKATLYPGYSSARTMLPRCCPCATNSIISLQFWNLHWLPVEQRIEYKVLLLTYKALHGKAPAYISQLLSVYTPTTPLRSETKNLLRVPRCRLEGFAGRCFVYAAPSFWNHLPTPIKRASSIDTFKSRLKTYLFNVAYPSIHWLLYHMGILFVTVLVFSTYKCFWAWCFLTIFFKSSLYKANIIIIIIVIIIIIIDIIIIVIIIIIIILSLYLFLLLLLSSLCKEEAKEEATLSLDMRCYNEIPVCLKPITSIWFYHPKS